MKNKIDWDKVKTTIYLVVWLVLMIGIPYLFLL